MHMEREQGRYVRSREAVESTIEDLIALLDALDLDPNLEPNGDEEPSLGASEGIGGWTAIGTDDREHDIDLDEGDPDDQDGDGEFSGGIQLGADEKTFCCEGENPADWRVAA